MLYVCIEFKTIKMEEIKILYKKLKDKKAFCEEISKETGTGARSIYNHWFGGFWDCPEKHQKLVLTKLKEKND